MLLPTEYAKSMFFTKGDRWSRHSLDTAIGSDLNDWGYLLGVDRGFFESDQSYRRRIIYKVKNPPAYGPTT